MAAIFSFPVFPPPTTTTQTYHAIFFLLGISIIINLFWVKAPRIIVSYYRNQPSEAHSQHEGQPTVIIGQRFKRAQYLAMNVPLFILLVSLTIAYFIDEIVALFPEEIQAKYYQLWMKMPLDKVFEAAAFQQLKPHEPLSPWQITYPCFAFKSQQLLVHEGVQIDLVFGLNVIYEST